MVLLFQAIITLIIGIAFFSQLTVIKNTDMADLTAELTSGSNFSEELPPTILDIKQRYTVAAYALFVISMIELLLISRLIS